MECHALEFLPNPNKAPKHASTRTRQSPRQTAGPTRRAYSGTSLPPFSLPEISYEVVDSLDALARMRAAVLGLEDRVAGQGGGVSEEAARAFSREHAYPAVSGWGVPAQAASAERGPEGSSASADAIAVARRPNATVSGARADASQHSPPPAGLASARAVQDTARPPRAWAADGDAESALHGRPGARGPVAVHARGFGTAVGAAVPEAHHMLEGPGPTHDLGSGSGLHPAVVGIDAEWEPGRREAPPGPVSLLQIATRQHVYLVDVLWFCGAGTALARGCAGDRGGPCLEGAVERRGEPGGGGARAYAAEAEREDLAVALKRSQTPPDSSSRALGASAGAQDEVPDGWARGAAAGFPDSGSDPCSTGCPNLNSYPDHGPAFRLSERARALSGFMGDLLGAAHVVKAGFGLDYDLRRLAESYPDLPCFGSAGGPVTAVRSHVDVLKLARAAFPPGQQVGAPPASQWGTRLWSLPCPAAAGCRIETCSMPCKDVALLLQRQSRSPFLKLSACLWHAPSFLHGCAGRDVLHTTLPMQALLGRVSLARLVARVTGRGLDKSQQCSAWGSRPLSGRQVAYAAADAACLVDVFDRLIERRPEVLDLRLCGQCIERLPTPRLNGCWPSAPCAQCLPVLSGQKVPGTACPSLL